MAELNYHLVIRMNTVQGEQIVGKFWLGTNHDTAYEIFNQLEGVESTGTGHFIYFDFEETDNGLPSNLHIIACSLEQAGNNVKLILKELFKSTSL